MLYQIQPMAGVCSLSAAYYLGFQLHVPLIKQTAGTRERESSKLMVDGERPRPLLPSATPADLAQEWLRCRTTR